jgi:ribosomal protein S18 acetylase RimI-like enzyme
MVNSDLTLMPSPILLDDSDSPLSAAGKAPHPLDNPIWNSLHSGHRSFAISNALARRYPPAIGPLSGIAEQSTENYEALRELAGPGGVVALFCTETPAPTPGWTLIRGGVLTQMICAQPVNEVSGPLSRGEEFRLLTTDDVPSMVELAELTEPGPFRERTIELGVFYGIFEKGRLLAMAGQRMHLPDSVEVSAVCTHPDARGRGYARKLIATVMDEIHQRGKTPFLHSFADNYPAIRVYESLGFTQRRTFELAVLKNRD